MSPRDLGVLGIRVIPGSNFLSIDGCPVASAPHPSSCGKFHRIVGSLLQVLSSFPRHRDASPFADVCGSVNFGDPVQRAPMDDAKASRSNVLVAAPGFSSQASHCLLLNTIAVVSARKGIRSEAIPTPT